MVEKVCSIPVSKQRSMKNTLNENEDVGVCAELCLSDFDCSNQEKCVSLMNKINFFKLYFQRSQMVVGILVQKRLIFR